MTRTDPLGAAVPASLLRRHRTRAGLTQRELARRVGYSRSTVANAETGDVRSADFYRRCDEVLGAGGALAAARDALHTRGAQHTHDAVHTHAAVHTHDAPTAPNDAAIHEAPRYAGGPLAAIPAEEAIEHLRRHWHLLVRTDNLLGPHAALPGVLDHLATLTALLSGAAGPTRTALLCLSARYALTASWLHQDAGRPDDAATWAGRALERAHESDDRASMAWALHRRSRLAEGDPERALSLARAALRQSADAQNPLAAALHVQCARTAALVGHRRECETMLARASVLADLRETTGDGRSGYGGHCTRTWVLAARGECELLLAAPASAVCPLRTALALLAPAYRRNRGLAMGWLAEACARLGDTEEAQRAAAECRTIGEATGSASVLAQARVVERVAEPRSAA